MLLEHRRSHPSKSLAVHAPSLRVRPAGACVVSVAPACTPVQVDDAGSGVVPVVAGALVRRPRAMSAARRSASVSTSASAAASAATSPRRDQPGRVAHDLGQRACSRRDDRRAERHRLERRHAEPLVPRRVREHGRASEQGDALRLGHPTEAGGCDGGGPLRRGPRSAPRRPSRRVRRPRGGAPGRTPPPHRTPRPRSAGPCAARPCPSARTYRSLLPGAGRCSRPPRVRRPAAGCSRSARRPRGRRRRANAPLTSSATNRLTVWTHAPRLTARSIKSGY